MISIEKIINKAKKKIPSLNEQRVLDAYNFANLCHSGQKRASGEDYIYHPLAIADIILDFLPDEDALLATLLHDVTEDCGIKVEEIKKRYGPVVAELVSGMEKLSHVKAYGQERQIGSLRKMFLAMAKDIRVVIIKLADRLHNMQSLHFLRPDKQKRIAEETLTIYAPIAARLGIYDLKSPLEDLSFFYLQQDKYTLVAEQMKKHEPYRTRILKNAKKYLSSTLHQDGIKGEITGRIKHYYSINKKMERKSMESIDDL
jgi:GTP pyrophosphokinase